MLKVLKDILLFIAILLSMAILLPIAFMIEIIKSIANSVKSRR